MSKVKIITDSCSDLPKEIVESYDIEFLSIKVNINDQVYYDRHDLQPKDFYRLINQGKEVPKTSRITPEIFKKTYQKALVDYDHVLVIAFSSKLSGILESAVVAKREIASDRITVIDTKAASVGQGLLVYQAAKWLQAGKSVDAVVQDLLEAASKLEHIFAVGSLDMLKKGGRITKGEAFIGNVLNIKPILHIQDGKILPYSRTRGKKKMMEFLLKMMDDRGHKLTEQIIGVNHSGNKELAEKIKNMIKDRYGISEFLVSEIGAAIGAHVGRNTVSVFFFNSEEVANIEIK